VTTGGECTLNIGQSRMLWCCHFTFVTIQHNDAHAQHWFAVDTHARGNSSCLCITMIATTLFVLLTLSVVPFVASAAQSDPIHIPITRRSNKSRGLHHLPKAADYLRAKYKFPTILSSRKRAGNTAAVPITNLVCHICVESNVPIDLLYTRIAT
jgi:hypothetical protein